MARAKLRGHMQRLLARIERSLGRYAIERLPTYLVGAMALVFVLSMTRPDVAAKLHLVPQLVAREPWRLVTFLFVPPDSSILWIFFALAFVHFVGSSLEATWGAFKLNVYFLVGALGTIAAAMISGRPQTNYYVIESMLFALATLAPNHEIYMLFFPLRLKWVALLGVVLIGVQFVGGDTATRIGIIVSFANYALFFTGTLFDALRGRRMEVRQAARRASFAPPPKLESASRACAICGKRQDDGADIRVCSCEKCGGPRELCLEHARAH